MRSCRQRLLVLVLAAGWICAFGVDAAQVVKRGVYDVNEVKKSMKELDWKSVPVYPPAVHRYFKYYDLDLEGIEHHFGTFSSTNYMLAAHVFKPEKSRGTVVLVHGYYDHTGILRHVIRDLLQREYTVAIYDQPGHGLSTGESASIRDFSEYLHVFRDFMTLCRKHLHGPFHLVAHSMGCAILTDYLLADRPTDLHGIVFLAPLIRSAAWKLSTLGLDLAGDTVDRVPRTFRKNSSDKAFLKFMKEDPLQARDVPLQWTRALRAWNERIEKVPASQQPLKVVQGTRDTTVDWKFSTEFLAKKFPKAELLLIKKGGHQLPNEGLPMRKRVLEEVAGYLPGDSSSTE